MARRLRPHSGQVQDAHHDLSLLTPWSSLR